MDRELAVVVATEASANEVLKALKQLDAASAIELYAAAVVAQQASGRVTLQDIGEARVSWGTALGAGVGALVGMLAGPGAAVAGAGLGADVGALVGRTYSGISCDFVHRVRARMEAQPGSFAVCASVWEDWSVPVDTAVAPFGGIVFRQATADVALAQMRSDVHAVQDERAHLEWEIAHASGEAKAKLESRRSGLQVKEEGLRSRLAKRADELQSGWDAKIANVQAKRPPSSPDAKAGFERRLSKVSQFVATERALLHDLFR
jgi:uncharacterized membrane protein